METDASIWSLNVGLGVLLVDILLSGDNAIVIALVCRSLSKAHRTKALWLGIAGAFVARLVLTGVATLAMNLPLIKLIGGLLLLKISIDLVVDNAAQDGLPIDPEDSSAEDVFAAARTIVLADIVMSLDNVVALSAISQNNLQMLIAGLLLSIPILMFGSLYIVRLLDLFPWLVWAGGALLGGVSGALIIDDPIFDGALNGASSLANLFVPLLAAVFVLQMGRVMGRNARHMVGLAKPRRLVDILWQSAPARPAVPAQEALKDHAAATATATATATEAATKPVLASSVQLAPAAASSGAAAVVAVPAVKSSVKPATPAKSAAGGEHRVVMALGLFMLLTGGAIYYMLNVYQPPVPDTFFTYFCKEPALSISFRPSARQIRFATPKGVVLTTVIEDRIVWDDYREAAARLSIAPPVKILMVDAAKLVVNGGAFDNSSCLAASQR